MRGLNLNVHVFYFSFFFIYLMHSLAERLSKFQTLGKRVSVYVIIRVGYNVLKLKSKNQKSGRHTFVFSNSLYIDII